MGENICTRVFVAGHKGMVGSALIRQLKNFDIKIITKDKSDLDLSNQLQVKNFFETYKSYKNKLITILIYLYYSQIIKIVFSEIF